MAKVIVAMSGGVDSSVAAAILKKQGHDVTGVTMEIWSGGGQCKKSKQHSCYGPDEKKDVEDARKVAEILEIPFYAFDLRGIYKSIVLDHFCSEYLLGRTPNPCIRCNRHIKLHALIEKAEAVVTPLNTNKARLRFKEPQSAITPGQAVVFYDNDSVLGGGIIESAGTSTRWS